MGVWKTRRGTKLRDGVASWEACAAAGMTLREAAVARGTSLSLGMRYAARHGLQFAPALESGLALTSTKHPNLCGPEPRPQRPGQHVTARAAEVDWFAPLSSRVIDERASAAFQAHHGRVAGEPGSAELLAHRAPFVQIPAGLEAEEGA